MQDTHKYLVHARITADGVVERSDVVGAVFGQTEGLLGDELDLRGLQDSSRIGRIDVQIDSEHGQSFGHITIASSLDKAETAILAASLEAITRVGPCEARVEVAEIEDMRAAKRREIVDRAKELLRESFDESVMESTEILEEVRDARRVEGIVEYEGLPAGPRVADSDAVIIVEGRSDVVRLLEYGIKNAVAVEGTNVPDVIADLTHERTVTAFLDGDRGGDLILRELAQVGDVDYVAAAPDGRSVEDLSRSDVMEALREKTPFEAVEFGHSSPTELADPSEAESDGGTAVGRADDVAPTDGSAGTDSPNTTTDPQTTDDPGDAKPAGGDTEPAGGDTEPAAGETEPTTNGADPVTTDAAGGTGAGSTTSADGPTSADGATDTDTASTSTGSGSASSAGAESADDGPRATSDAEETDGFATLQTHVREVIGAESKRARLLNREMALVQDVPAAEAFDAISASDGESFAVVLDDRLEQRLLDVAAQHGIEQIVARSEGEYVKRPASVRVVTADRLVSS